MSSLNVSSLCLRLSLLRRQWCRSCVFIVNFEQILHFLSVSFVQIELVNVCWDVLLPPITLWQVTWGKLSSQCGVYIRKLLLNHKVKYDKRVDWQMTKPGFVSWHVVISSICMHKTKISNELCETRKWDLQILITRVNCNGNLQRGLLAQLLN